MRVYIDIIYMRDINTGAGYFYLNIVLRFELLNICLPIRVDLDDGIRPEHI